MLDIPPSILPLLKRLKEKARNNVKLHLVEYVFVNITEDEKPYTPTKLSRDFKKVLQQNNLPPIRFHDLRHSYATLAHNSGMPIKHLSKTLGHSTAAITIEQYVHDEESSDDEAESG